MTEGIASNPCGGTRPVVIVGPTASGKTAAAVELAKRTDAEIISADSMAIYRGMDIGTAKPTAEERRAATFHMIDVVDPDDPFTVSDFQEQAARIVDELIARSRLPLIVGGTGLYVRALIDGLNIPGLGPNPELRQQLEQIAREKGNVYLHRELAKVDPETAGRLHPNDLKRVIRALEVYSQAGAPMSELVERTKRSEPRYPDALQFGLTMDRKLLYQRIEDRVDRLITDGLVGEVAGLLDQGYDVDLPAMQGLGYKEIVGYLKGQYDLEFAVELLKRDTRRFAKRQFTWFRADARVQWIDVDNLPVSEVADLLETRLRDVGVLGQG
jgi:tRNA dimethylallyltransferase